MFTQDLFSVLSAGGPPGRLQVQVRVHHVPCDTTELCTRRFGAETSKPDVGQPRLKALLRLRQVPFFAKKAPLVELRLPSKGREREEGGGRTAPWEPARGRQGPFQRPLDGPLPPAKGPLERPEGPLDPRQRPSDAP